jgi:hypothetical protein
MEALSVETERLEAAFVFPLSGEEREALVRLLRVVEDKCRLDDVERALLERFEGVDVTAVSAR